MISVEIQLKPCGDCRVEPGTAHDSGCDIARCMKTGQQRIQCDDCDHCESCTCEPCPDDIWSGEWPGVAECREFGWWCYFGPDYGETGWIRCAADDPRATPDLSRLMVEARWDSATKRWVKP